MDIHELFTENQRGLLEEALNIGAGNAVTALSQILQCDTDMSFPVLKGFLTPLTPATFQNIADNSTCVEMEIVGELQGGLAVVIPNTDVNKLTGIIRQARDEQRAEGVADISILTETSNIMAGSFLTALHDFCGLNIFHTVPTSEPRNPEYLLNIIQKQADHSSDVLLVITNEFIVNKLDVKAYLLVILSADSTSNLIQAIEKIRVV
jgi:chemotaxis protein CheC